jgi:hypothetical protein
VVLNETLSIYPNGLWLTALSQPLAGSVDSRRPSIRLNGFRAAVRWLPKATEPGGSCGICFYGSKRDVYRVIYDIDELQQIVRVRAVRHSAMDEFKT